ncbi:MAG: asparagine synthase-related protein, partial [Sphingopyxis sp.]
SAVVAFMAEASSSAVNSCAIGFDDSRLDETSYAEVIARRFATDHRTRIVASDDFAIADIVAAHCDEPFADASALPTYRVSQLAREEVTVALSGDGADEAFAGYRRLVFQHQEERARRFLPGTLRRGVLGPLSRVWPQMDWAPRPLRAKATLTGLARSGEEAYALSVGVTGPDMRSRLYTDATRAALAGYAAEERWWSAMRGAPACEPLDRAQYADMKIALPGDILTKVDRMSMAVSLEAREPLLDHHLVAFAASLPAHMRVRGSIGKWLMKKALERSLPRDILYRPKMGFVTPISTWFRAGLAAQARALGASPTLARTGWFDMNAVAALVAAHQSGASDHGRQIWQFFMLEKSLQRLFGI